MAGHTDNQVRIEAPAGFVFDVTNDFDRWTEMFGEYASVCGDAVCGTAQCGAAVDRCISYCCSQDGSCVSAAHARMDSEGWN